MGKRQRKGRRRLVGGCRHYFLFPPQLSTVFLPTDGVRAVVSPVSARRPQLSDPSPGHRSALSGRWCLFVVELYPMSCLTCHIGSWLLAFLSRLPKSVVPTHITSWLNFATWPCGPAFLCSGPFAASMLQPLHRHFLLSSARAASNSRHTWALFT